jgi:phosphotriesterase-related protein
MRTVHAVTGPIAADTLGTTLMHEHLAIGYPGFEAEAVADRAARREYVARCVERMQELRGHGLRTLVDPCPIDLGRDVELMAEVAQQSGVHIVCATGLYKEDEGAAAYFKFRQHWGDALGEMTDLFVRELTDGVGDTGIRAGVIKVGTGVGRITPYEETVLRAAGKAHKATGAPITTHTGSRARWGPRSSTCCRARASTRAPSSSAIPAARATSTTTSTCSTAARRSASTASASRSCIPDRERLAVLIGLLGIGFERQLVLSHDTVWCWRGRAPKLPPDLLPLWKPTYVFETIVPKLKEAGVSQAKIETMLVENPRRYFAGV